jgi:hypothetical protein
LTAGKELHIFEPREKIVKIGAALRIVIDEWRGLHDIARSVMQGILVAAASEANSSRRYVAAAAALC